MPSLLVIGDELACAGFRLAGVATLCPTAAEVPAAFSRALEHAALLVLTRAHADLLEPKALRRAVLRAAPPVVVMPDLTAPGADSGFVARMRAVLSIEA